MNVNSRLRLKVAFARISGVVSLVCFLLLLGAPAGTNRVAKDAHGNEFEFHAVNAPASFGQDEVEFNLEFVGGPFASRLRVPDDSPLHDVQSIQLRGFIERGGRGEATLVLDSTPRSINLFGDEELLDEPSQQTIAIKFEPVELPRIRSTTGRKVFAVTSETALNCKLYFSFSADVTRDSRLVIATEDLARLEFGRASAADVVSLRSQSMDALAHRAQSSERDGKAIDLQSPPLATGRGFVDFRIEGELDGDAKFHLDPNSKSITATGEFGMSTLLGWRPRPVRLVRQLEEDPLDEGRVRYEIVCDGPRQVRYFIVLSESDGDHRLVITREGEVEHVVQLWNRGQ